jgi:hypothetical protein
MRAGTGDAGHSCLDRRAIPRRNRLPTRHFSVLRLYSISTSVNLP